MKLYTRGGDDGTTGLAGGGRVHKDDARVKACGETDETNAAIGMVLAECQDPDLEAKLRQIQSDLFALGSELAGADGKSARPGIGDEHIARLESWIDTSSEEVSALKHFIMPGGTSAAAGLHFARTVCRRAERAAVTLGRRESISLHAVIYLNRLSDLLFALARQANHRAGVTDVPWTPKKG